METRKTKGAQTKARVAQVAQRLFKLHGYEGVGIDTIMAEAGLTRGGFYAHFSNKAELLEHAIHAQPGEEQNPVPLMPPGRDKLETFIETYVNLDHAEDIAGGCPVTGMLPIVAQADEAAKKAYAQQFEGMRKFLAECIEKPNADDIALRLVVTCIGGLSVARAMEDPEAAQAVIEQTRAAARALVF